MLPMHRKTRTRGRIGHRIAAAVGLLATVLLFGPLGSGCNCTNEPTLEPAELSSGDSTTGTSGRGDEPDNTDPEGPTAGRLTLGDWESYPTVAEDAEWPDEPLDAQRWARVSAELACAGRKNRGDPNSQRQKVRNIVAHQRTSLEAVAEWSTRFNRDQPEQARRWARPISNAVKGCR